MIEPLGDRDKFNMDMIHRAVENSRIPDPLVRGWRKITDADNHEMSAAPKITDSDRAMLKSAGIRWDEAGPLELAREKIMALEAERQTRLSARDWDEWRSQFTDRNEDRDEREG